jgi:hypothetical protein
MTTDDPIKSLRDFVAHLKEGPIHGEHEKDLRRLLFNCWEELKGSDQTSMDILKLHRAENLSDRPPNVLEFDIERHGATVYGSIYAHMYHWTIDLDKGSANHDYPAQRIVGKRDAPLRVDPLAEQVAKDITFSLLIYHTFLPVK